MTTQVFIANARIIDPSSPDHGQTRNLLINNGRIQFTAAATPGAQVIEAPGLCVSPGWVDIFSQFHDPGHEEKETLDSGLEAARRGGFTHVFLLPNTSPVTQGKTQVEYLQSRNHLQATEIHPLGAITRGTEGRELADMYEMREAGAIAFTDGTRPVQSAGLLIKALQYVKAFRGILIQIPDDQSIGTNGLMHEGVTSTRLGLPGKPAMAEEIMVARDIKLARYADSAIHFTGISSAKSLEYIARAREGGIRVSCSVAPSHLVFTDEDLGTYDTNLKVYPAIRSQQDRQALLRGIESGVVDLVASHHMPQEWDRKTCEFEYASPGMIALETAFGASRRAGVSPEDWVRMNALRARELFGLPAVSISEGAEADLTLFQPDVTFTFEGTHIGSLSRNTPFVGQQLVGKILGVIRKGHVSLNA